MQRLIITSSTKYQLKIGWLGVEHLVKNILLCFVFLLSSCGNTLQNATDLSATELSNKIVIRYQVIDNVSAKDCNTLAKSGLCFDAKIKLKLKEVSTLQSWRIYFSHMTPIIRDYSDQFNIGRINGDLHFIEPTKSFEGWKGDVLVDIPFKAEFWHISEFDSPPNFYLVDNTGASHLIDSTRSKLDPDSRQEYLPHMSNFTDSNKQFKRGKADLSEWATAEQLFNRNSQILRSSKDSTSRIIPKPYSVKLPVALDAQTENFLNISDGINIKKNIFQINQTDPAIKRMKRLGVTFDQNKSVSIAIVESKDIRDDEGYRLIINNEGIRLYASASAGAFYGLQSIAALLDTSKMKLPFIEVIDKPHYSFRGFFLDVARNFRNKEFVVRLLDQMAAYKLNKFHFHLGDDEGWRLEIPGLPELTQLGAYRCHDLTEKDCLLPTLGNGPNKNNPNNGFYSIDDYQYILKQAKIRHIQVIPSFDMPGHSRAAVKAMQFRYRKMVAVGKIELAEEFLLSDKNDQSRYLSVQYYNDNTLNVCMESTYRFVAKIVDEVALIHKQVKMPLTTYHIGADETPGAWVDSPICTDFIEKEAIETSELGSYFIKRVSKMLSSRDIQTGGWSDGLTKLSKSELPKNIHANAWTPLFWDGHKVAHSMVNDDWEVVLSLPDVTYFDFPYEADPKERGYYWGSRYTNTRQIFDWMPDNLPLHAEIWNDRKNIPMLLDDTAEVNDLVGGKKRSYSPLKSGKSIKGIQAQLWSEMIRTDEIAEYMIFPRLLAIAERAWHQPNWQPAYDYDGKIYSNQTQYFTEADMKQRDTDWLEFANALSDKEFEKMDIDGIFYRIPTVGGMVENGKLHLNSIFPRMNLEYKLNDADWKEYIHRESIVNISEDDSIKIRAKNPSGTRVGRALIVN